MIGQSSILVGLPDAVERGSVLVLDVVYGGRLEPQVLDREAIEVQGTRQETQDQQLVMTPEPRFLYSNRVPWYPQSGSTDYATAELRLSVPSEYQVVASAARFSAPLSCRHNDARPAACPSRFVSSSTWRIGPCAISRASSADSCRSAARASRCRASRHRWFNVPAPRPGNRRGESRRGLHVAHDRPQSADATAGVRQS